MQKDEVEICQGPVFPNFSSSFEELHVFSIQAKVRLSSGYTRRSKPQHRVMSSPLIVYGLKAKYEVYMFR